MTVASISDSVRVYL